MPHGLPRLRWQKAANKAMNTATYTCRGQQSVHTKATQCAVTMQICNQHRTGNPMLFSQEYCTFIVTPNHAGRVPMLAQVFQGRLQRSQSQDSTWDLVLHLYRGQIKDPRCLKTCVCMFMLECIRYVRTHIIRCISRKMFCIYMYIYILYMYTCFLIEISC